MFKFLLHFLRYNLPTLKLNGCFTTRAELTSQTSIQHISQSELGHMTKLRVVHVIAKGVFRTIEHFSQKTFGNSTLFKKKMLLHPTLNNNYLKNDCIKSCISCKNIANDSNL